MVNFCVNACFIISWIAVPTLAFFSWIAYTEPMLLEIKEENQSEGKEVLTISTFVYLVIAIIMTVLKELGAKKRKRMEQGSKLHAEGKTFGRSDSIEIEDVVQRKFNKEASHLDSRTSGIDSSMGMTFDSR